MRILVALCAAANLFATGCDGLLATKPTSTVSNKSITQIPVQQTPATTAPARTAPTTPATPRTTPSGVVPPQPEPEPVIPTRPEEPLDPFEEPEGKPEPLPELPKSDPKSVVKELVKDKTLFLEIRPDGGKRVLIATEVCLRRGMLEVFLCKKQTKEHESILRTSVDARFIHAALVAAGGKVGKPVQFINPKTEEAEYKPATGQTIRVSVAYNKDGKVHQHPAHEWIIDKKTNKPMTHNWVFAGSRFLKNPDMPEQPDYYTANNGEVISLANYIDSMLELPVQISRETPEVFFDAATKKIPPLGSQVWVILEAVPEKK